MDEPVAMTMTQILSNLTEIFTAVIGYVATVASTITSNPLLLIFVLIPIIGLVYLGRYKTEEKIWNTTAIMAM